MVVLTVAFVKVLDDLASTSTKFRKSAFLKAKKSLLALNKIHVSIEDVENLDGFGTGILSRFREFEQYNELEELKETEERIIVIELFQKIYGVGPVLANRFYDLGYRTLQDIPHDILTPSQLLGVIHYNEINARISREEIKEIDRVLQSKVSLFNREHKMKVRATICGSYLRGNADSGDIDIIISEKNDKDFISTFLKHNIIVKNILAQGSTKVLCLGGLSKFRHRIDFELVKDKEWAFALLYFTGSKNFNQHMRGIAKSKNMLLNHKGLFIGEDTQIYLESEKEIFAFLDMPYRSPEERNM